jgi:predicted CXXCH cytochrome family protein
MDSLIIEINDKLLDDPRIEFEHIPYGSDVGIRYSIDSCPSSSSCMLLFVELEESRRGHKYWLDFMTFRDCDGKCNDIFSDSLPPVETFLQRRELANVLTEDSKSEYCLYCFRKKGYVNRVDSMCTKCHQAHKQEGNELVKKKMIVECLLGEDIAGVVLDYLLCFFAEDPQKKNQY